MTKSLPRFLRDATYGGVGRQLSRFHRLSLPTLALAVAAIADCALLVLLHSVPHCTPLLIACRHFILLPALVWSLRPRRRDA